MSTTVSHTSLQEQLALSSEPTELLASERKKISWDRSLLDNLKTFYHELAELGVLDMFLREYFHEKITTDEQFEEKMYAIITDVAPEAVAVVERYLLRKLLLNLQMFNKTARACLQPIPKH